MRCHKFHTGAAQNAKEVLKYLKKYLKVLKRQNALWEIIGAANAAPATPSVMLFGSTVSRRLRNEPSKLTTAAGLLTVGTDRSL